MPSSWKVSLSKDEVQSGEIQSYSYVYEPSYTLSSEFPSTLNYNWSMNNQDGIAFINEGSTEEDKKTKANPKIKFTKLGKYKLTLNIAYTSGGRNFVKSKTQTITVSTYPYITLDKYSVNSFSEMATVAGRAYGSLNTSSYEWIVSSGSESNLLFYKSIRDTLYNSNNKRSKSLFIKANQNGSYKLKLKAITSDTIPVAVYSEELTLNWYAPVSISSASLTTENNKQYLKAGDYIYLNLSLSNPVALSSITDPTKTKVDITYNGKIKSFIYEPIKSTANNLVFKSIVASSDSGQTFSYKQGTSIASSIKIKDSNNNYINQILPGAAQVNSIAANFIIDTKIDPVIPTKIATVTKTPDITISGSCKASSTININVAVLNSSPTNTSTGCGNDGKFNEIVPLSFPDGSSIKFAIKQTDLSGNISKEVFLTTKKDTPPTKPRNVGFSESPVINRKVNIVYSKSIDSNLTTHEVKLCEKNDCSGTCASATSATETAAITAPKDGFFYACVRGKDASGSYSDWAASQTSKAVGSSLPLATISSNITEGSKTNNKTYEFNVSGSNVISYKYKVIFANDNCNTINFQDLLSISTNQKINETINSDGEYKICVVGINSSNIIQQTPTSFSWNYDGTPPIALITDKNIPNSGYTNNSNISFTIGKSADLSSFKWALVNQADATDPCQSTNYSQEINITSDHTINESISGGDGHYFICLVGKDNSGNWQQTSSALRSGFIYDSTLPQIVSSNSISTNGQATLSPVITETNISSYTWENITSGGGTVTFGSSTAASTSVNTSSDGTYLIKLTVTDTAGNSASNTFTVIKDTQAPTANITWTSVNNLTDKTTTSLNYEFTVEGEDVESYRYILVQSPSVCPTELTGYSSDFSKNIKIVGSAQNTDTTYILCVISKDKAGNWQSASIASSFSWTVMDIPSISYSSNSFIFTKNTAISYILPTSTGISVSYSISPSLPAGLNFSTSTGVISGTPTELIGQSTFTVKAQNTSGDNTASINITVNDIQPNISFNPSSNSLYANESITLSPSNSGGAITSCTVTPNLPQGLSLTSTCTITGTPTLLQSSSNYTITATNSGGNKSVSISISIISRDSTPPNLSSYYLSSSSGAATNVMAYFISDEAATIGLYSSNSCSGSMLSTQSINVNHSVSSSLQAIGLTVGATTSIYAKATDGANNSSCTLIGTYQQKYPNISNIKYAEFADLGSLPTIKYTSKMKFNIDLTDEMNLEKSDGNIVLGPSVYVTGSTQSINLTDYTNSLGSLYLRSNSSNSSPRTLIGSSVGRIPPSFSINGCNFTVKASAVNGSDLYIGGEFALSSYAGSPICGVSTASYPSTKNMSGVFKWNGYGWSSLGKFTGGYIESLAIDSNGILYAGGSFNNVNGNSMNALVKFSGSSWTTLSTGLPSGSSVRAIKPDLNGNIYIGGSFATAGGITVNGIAKWNGSTFSSIGSGVSGGMVYAINLDSSNNIYVGGSFTSIGGVAVSYFAKWTGTTWTYVGSSASAGPNGQVNAIAIDGSTIYAGGSFNYPNSYLTKFNGSSWSSVGSSSVSYGQIWTLLINNGLLYAGGEHVSTGSLGTGSAYISKFDIASSTWSKLSDGLNDFVYTISVDKINNKIYAGGRFTTSSNTTAAPVYSTIVAWNGTNFYPLGSGLRYNTTYSNASITTITAASRNTNGDIYIGGVFTGLNQSSNISSTYNLAKWDSVNNSWSLIVNGTTNGNINAMEFDNSGNLYVGGSFTTISGISANYIAKYTVSNGSWSTLGTGTYNGTNGTVKTIQFDGLGNIYVGGDFAKAGNITVNKIAKWNGTAWSYLGSTPGVTTTGYVNTIEIDKNGILYAGGYFSTAGGSNANNIAKWDGSSWSPLAGGLTQGGTSGTGNVNSIYIDRNNIVYVGGSFTTANINTTVDNIAKWNGTSWGSISADGSGTYGTSVSAISGDEYGNIYVGGSFTNVGLNGSVAAARLAKWNGSTWSQVGGGIGAGEPTSQTLIKYLGVFDDNLFVSGSFLMVDGKVRPSLTIYSITFSQFY